MAIHTDHHAGDGTKREDRDRDGDGDKDEGQEQRHKLELEKQQRHHQMQRDLADAISRLASLDEIRILLAGGARVDGPVTQGLHPIHYAAYQNFVPAVRLLILRGCDINAMDDNGYTPVHLAAERGYYDLLKLLISNGAKVCFTDAKRLGTINSMADEPLSLALKRDHRDCAELLLDNGADPNARYFMGSEINLVSILKVSCIKLLLEHGAHPDSRDRTGLTPLMKAARHPQGYATVKLLIEHGADVNDIAGERHDHRTVLHHSIFSGNVDLIRLLLTSGARYPELDFDKPSPMDIAIISGRHDIVGLLVEFGANINAGANTTIGQPLHTALTQRIENRYQIVRLLLDSGADPNSPFTSNRETGPPLQDYLLSIRQFGIMTPAPTQSQSSSPWLFKERGAAELEMIRLLLMYGARVVLKTRTQNPLGLVRALEKCQEELTLDILHLLIEASEEIDWFMMSKVVYGCLRHTNRSRTNELFDPSVAADMTPELLSSLLADTKAHHQGLNESLIKLLNQGRTPTAVPSLKHMTRIHIRRHLIAELKLTGRALIAALETLPLPPVLNRYLLYQDSYYHHNSNHQQ